MTHTVILVDDHALVRAGTRMVIEQSAEFQVIAECASAEEGLERVRGIKPDLILLDLNLPGMPGNEALPKFLRATPSSKIVVLTMHEEGPMPARVLESGALGYLSKGCDAQCLMDCLRSVVRGQPYLDPKIAQRLAWAKAVREPDSPFERLTPTELELMQRMATGLTVQDLAAQWRRSPKTLHTHKMRAFEKLGVRNEVEMTRLAIRFGLVELA